jgi:hypothetical protein
MWGFLNERKGQIDIVDWLVVASLRWLCYRSSSRSLAELCRYPFRFSQQVGCLGGTFGQIRNVGRALVFPRRSASAGNEQVFAISNGDRARSRSLIKRRGWGAQR